VQLEVRRNKSGSHVDVAQVLWMVTKEIWMHDRVGQRAPKASAGNDLLSISAMIAKFEDEVDFKWMEGMFQVS